MGFFRSIRKTFDRARTLGSKALEGVNAIGQKVGDVASKVADSVGNIPIVGGFAQNALNKVADVARGVGSSALDLRKGDFDKLAQDASSTASAFESLPTASQAKAVAQSAVDALPQFK